MPAKYEWTSRQDAELIALRERKVPWADCAKAMRCARNTVIEHGRRIGLPKRPGLSGAGTPPALTAPAPTAGRDDLDERGFRSGHPATWGLLLSLTPSLAGASYAP